MEKKIVEICLANARPHWAATGASLLWAQFLSASELLLVSRVDASQLPYRDSSLKAFLSATALLWNMRRVNTRWQVKNVPSSADQQRQSRTAFVLTRLAATLAAYLLVELAVSQPPPDAELVQLDKATLFHLNALSSGDWIFRSAMTVSYWLITGTVVLFMNHVGTSILVFLQLSDPADCPPLFGSFLDAYTVRRFWGTTWHQMFRAFLTGHADLIVDNALPFLPRRSCFSRYSRLAIAFFISGAIHYRAEQLMGVPDAENGAIIFFLLHAAAIMVEDTIAPLVTAVITAPWLRRVLGWVWVLAFFIWSSPIWTYSGTRVGLDSGALLPVRVIGPWLNGIKA